MMKRSLHIYPMTQQLNHQRGVSSFIVMMILVLALASVLVAQRIGILNEAFIGSDSDAQRSFAAAEAVMQDAKLDVRGFRLGANGVTTAPCSTIAPPGSCRVAGGVFFPPRGDPKAMSKLRSRIPTNKNCQQGICAPAVPLAPFWLNETTLDTMKAQAAKYGQFTQTSSAGNEILQNKAWYWVEVYEYVGSLGVSTAFNSPYAPNLQRPFVFRITAIAEGKKAGSRTVLQSVFVPSLSVPLQ